MAPPLALITELGRHASILSHALNQYTIRHEHIEPGGAVHHSTYSSVISFVQEEALNDPSLLTAPYREEKEEYNLYRNLGFSEQEYKDLHKWKESWENYHFDLNAAFDEFAGKIVKEIMAGRDSILLADIVPGVAGIVGIAIDVVFFATSAMAPALVSSCATGLAAIAAKFPVVRQKLLGRGQS